MNHEATAGPAVDEKLVEGASVQWRLAGERCDESCFWYHGPRGYLRALGILRGMAKDATFLLDALTREALRLGPSRVLISGAADCGMLAHVAAAYAAAGRPFDATVVDRCGTPLGVNTWYAGAAGLSVATVQSDILDFEASQPFDVISTHSFFSFFDEPDRPGLIDRWRGLVRPGGSVVTALGVYRTPSDLAQADAARARVYRDRARSVDEAACRRLGVDRRMVIDWVETHVQRKVHRRVRSVKMLCRLFERGGFRMTEVSTAHASRVDGALRVGVVAERLH